MKKVFFILLFVMLVFCGFSQNYKNDSINEEHNYFLGFTFGPNYSWRQYQFEKKSFTGFSHGSAEDDMPSMGYSIQLMGKITKKHFMFNIASGLGVYSYKGKTIIGDFPNNYRREEAYIYTHKLYGINTGYNLLLGKKKFWNLGVTADINYISSLIQNVKTDVYEWNELTMKYDYTYDFTRKQLVFWGGLIVGRSIKAAQWLMVDVSVSGKYSSTIYIEDSGSYPNNKTTQPRRLLSSALNITFYPIFK